MNWDKVIIALEQAASDAQDSANLLATTKDKRAAHWDANADLLRAIVRALRHGKL